jgi:hypothetical protein
MVLAALEATDPLGRLVDWQSDSSNTREAVRDAYAAMLSVAPPPASTPPSPTPSARRRGEDEVERVAFESWANADVGGDWNLARIPDGRYICPNTSRAWRVWQARTALAAAPCCATGAAELERVRAVALAEARRTVAAQDESLHYQRRVVAFVEAAGRAHSLLRYPYHSAEDRAEAVDLLRLVLEGGEPSLSLTRAQFVAWADGAGFDTRTFENSPDFKERTTALAFEGWVARGAFAPTAQPSETVTYSSTQATNCAGCGQHKHTPLRVDAMGGYVCLTCIDAKLEALLESEGGGQEGGEDRHALARRVWEALDRKSCPGVYMQIAYETIAGSTTAPAPVEGGR